jgi:hypothetical protein
MNRFILIAPIVAVFFAVLAQAYGLWPGVVGGLVAGGLLWVLMGGPDDLKGA